MTLSLSSKDKRARKEIIRDQDSRERRSKMADSRTINFDVRIKQIIKPSSPTLPHLERLQLSLFDQLIVDVYVPLVFFYSQNDGDGLGQRSQILKSSLSNVLTQFYPLAGRMKDNAWVECNDEGVDYTEAQVDCSISEILEQPNLELLIKFPPADSTTFSGAAANNGPLISIKVSFFSCGGLAIGIWFSHKVLDVASLTAFMNSWAAICRGDPSHSFPPDYTVAPSLFPPLEIPLKVVELPNPKYKYVMKTFVFHSSKIAELKAKAASERVPQPSRVEAVTALIWKCAMAASRSNYRSSKPSAVHQPVNLRKRIVSDNSMGNLLGVFVAQIGDGTEVQLPVLVDQLRMKLEEATKMFEEKLQGGAEASSIIFGFYEELGELYNKGDKIDVYSFTSWCKFPLYEADFGWGKPSWVSIPPVAVNNNIVLMDTKEGEGIEAWVTLREEDMALFKHDQELLTFASLSCSP